MPDQHASENTATHNSGRAASALNRLTHGGTSTSLFVKNENPDEFFALLENAFQLHQPTNAEDAELVTDTVLARWFVLRRQRMCLDFEASLHERKPLSTYWIAPDFDDIQRLDRYRTQAERALTRALNNVRHIRKDTSTQNHWQAQHDLQKERFALQRERFELAKQREARLAAKRAEKQAKSETLTEKQEPEENQMKETKKAKSALEEMLAHFADDRRVEVDENGAYISQAVFVAIDGGVTNVMDVTPNNHTVRQIILTASEFPTPPTEVVRTYIFAGGIPPEYRHLMTQNWQAMVDYQEIRKTYSFPEWQELAHREDHRKQQPTDRAA